MTYHTDAERALSNLRHLYSQMAGGLVKDSAQAKRIAEGLLSPAIARLEQAARRAPAAQVPQVTPEMIEAAQEAYMPFGDMELAIQCALSAAPQPPEGLKRENPATKPEAAPVELPIPAAICTEVRTEFMQDFMRKEYGLQAVFGAKIEFNENLYTEQQVRDLLADHGIGKDKA